MIKTQYLSQDEMLYYFSNKVQKWIEETKIKEIISIQYFTTKDVSGRMLRYRSECIITYKI
jgi:predicted ATP-grasp superfamily ATP-dependent carboligase